MVEHFPTLLGSAPKEPQSGALDTCSSGSRQQLTAMAQPEWDLQLTHHRAAVFGPLSAGGCSLPLASVSPSLTSPSPFGTLTSGIRCAPDLESTLTSKELEQYRIYGSGPTSRIYD